MPESSCFRVAAMKRIVAFGASVWEGGHGRFRLEAVACARVLHPHAALVHGFGGGLFWALEDQLVVNLQQHVAAEPLVELRFVDEKHRHLHDVRRAPLDGEVAGLAFSAFALSLVHRHDLGEEPPATEDGERVARLPRLLEGFAHERGDRGVALHELVDECDGFFLGAAQARCEGLFLHADGATVLRECLRKD